MLLKTVVYLWLATERDMYEPQGLTFGACYTSMYGLHQIVLRQVRLVAQHTAVSFLFGT